MARHRCFSQRETIRENVALLRLAKTADVSAPNDVKETAALLPAKSVNTNATDRIGTTPLPLARHKASSPPPSSCSNTARRNPNLLGA
jgi:hypothetical protein